MDSQGDDEGKDISIDCNIRQQHYNGWCTPLRAATQNTHTHTQTHYRIPRLRMRTEA